MAGTAPIAAVLTLSPDNPCNTTLLNEDGKELYHVHTEHGSATTTFVKDADGQVLASLEWRDVLPDKVTLGQNSKGPMSIPDWLHTSLVPFYLKECVRRPTRIRCLVLEVAKLADRGMYAATSTSRMTQGASTNGAETRLGAPSRYVSSHRDVVRNRPSA